MVHLEDSIQLSGITIGDNFPFISRLDVSVHPSQAIHGFADIFHIPISSLSQAEKPKPTHSFLVWERRCTLWSFLTLKLIQFNTHWAGELNTPQNIKNMCAL